MAINQKGRADNDEDRQKLVDQCSFPLFQDAPTVDAWALHGGQKDDLYIYGSDGKLVRFLPHAAGKTDLGDPQAYAAFKAAVLEAR